MLAAIQERMGEIGLRLHPEKTRIVYCRDGNRRGSAKHTSFTFLGFEFRARAARNKHGVVFTSFLPAISKDALTKLGRDVRGWKVHRRTDLSLAELARLINPKAAGWMRYYGAFYPSALYGLLARINTYLMRWLRKKFKRFHAHRRARAAWERLQQRYPRGFVHWAWVRNPLMIKMAGAR